jgi:hypothetical protein
MHHIIFYNREIGAIPVVEACQIFMASKFPDQHIGRIAVGDYQEEVGFGAEITHGDPTTYSLGEEYRQTVHLVVWTGEGRFVQWEGQNYDIVWSDEEEGYVLAEPRASATAS